MAKIAWLAAPIAVVVLHRLAWSAGATTSTITLLLLAVASFGALLVVGLILHRVGVRSRALGFVLAALFWLSAPTLAVRPPGAATATGWPGCSSRGSAATRGAGRR